MIGGQVLDIESEHIKPTAELVDAIHRAKTGALIRVSVVTGGIYAGATADDVYAPGPLGRKAGLAFQIADDVLDMTQDSAHLGKTAGKDLATEESDLACRLRHRTEPAPRRANLIEEAFAALAPYGSRADGLKALASYRLSARASQWLTDAEIPDRPADCYDPEVKLNLVDLA